MTIYLFIYTIFGWLVTYILVTEEPSLFKHHLYLKATLITIIWPIFIPLYLAILATS